METLTLSDYESLAELRYQIRCFLSFSEQAARAAGLEPRQHQLMLGLKGLPRGARPTIGELAERLQIQHHSAVELVNRLAATGYLRRTRGGEDRREVLVSLTPRKIAELSPAMVEFPGSVNVVIKPFDVLYTSIYAGKAPKKPFWIWAPAPATAFANIIVMGPWPGPPKLPLVPFVHRS